MTEVTSTSESPDISVSANAKLADGKRHLLCGEIMNAVNSLQEACKLFAAKYGEAKDECGEVYFYYGKALLELGRMENGVLGNALQGEEEAYEDDDDDESVPDEDEATTSKEGAAMATDSSNLENPDDVQGDERDKVIEEVHDALAAPRGPENYGEKKGVDAEDDFPKDDSEAKNGTEAKGNGEKNEESTEAAQECEEEEMDQGEDTAESAAEGDQGTEDEGEETAEDTAEDADNAGAETDSDDIPNFQLAWEMLELAKVIYLRQPTKDMQLKAAQCLLSLGEVGLETEQYSQCIEDFGQCLKLQKENLDADDRLIAETYYQLGMTYSFSQQHDSAVESHTQAMAILQARIDRLKKIVAEAMDKGYEGEKEGEESPVMKARKEISNISEILPDICAKIEDAQEEKKAMDKLKAEAKEIAVATAGFGSASSEAAQPIGLKKADSTPASDISSLVRKKRKTDEGQENGVDKKPRQENGSGDGPHSNGADEQAANGVANGQAIKVKTVEDVLKAKEAAEASS